VARIFKAIIRTGIIPPAFLSAAVDDCLPPDP
jgi:hypothetical protein